MSDETLNSEPKATFSFQTILKGKEGVDGMNTLDQIAVELSGRFKAGSKAEVGTSVFGVTREVLDNLNQLDSADSIRALNRLDNFLIGVFGEEYQKAKAGVFAEFAVMKAIRDEVGCGIQMPSVDDDKHGVDLWVDISPDENGSEMLALQIKYTARFGDRDSDPQAIFALLDNVQDRERLSLYLNNGGRQESALGMRRMENYVMMGASQEGAPKFRTAYVALSSHHSWFDKKTGLPNKRLTSFLADNILDGLVYSKQPKGDQNE